VKKEKRRNSNHIKEEARIVPTRKIKMEKRKPYLPKKHKFGRPHFDDGIRIYEVKCLETGGCFCTSVWRSGKFPHNKCPCCGQEVE